MVFINAVVQVLLITELWTIGLCMSFFRVNLWINLLVFLLCVCVHVAIPGKKGVSSYIIIVLRIIDFF